MIVMVMSIDDVGDDHHNDNAGDSDDDTATFTGRYIINIL